MPALGDFAPFSLPPRPTRLTIFIVSQCRPMSMHKRRRKRVCVMLRFDIFVKVKMIHEKVKSSRDRCDCQAYAMSCGRWKRHLVSDMSYCSLVNVDV